MANWYGLSVIRFLSRCVLCEASPLPLVLIFGLIQVQDHLAQTIFGLGKRLYQTENLIASPIAFHIQEAYVIQ